MNYEDLKSTNYNSLPIYSSLNTEDKLAVMQFLMAVFSNPSIKRLEIKFLIADLKPELVRAAISEMGKYHRILEESKYSQNLYSGISDFLKGN